MIIYVELCIAESRLNLTTRSVAGSSLESNK